jgi:hypothetical protein
MATTQAVSAGLQTIALDLIAPNPLNPRKHFEKGPLAELAESIKVHGVRQPILVRPSGKAFQLVVGERRWRASKLAGKADIPAIVDPQLDDRQALEIMVIENLQREDVHPLDEALGYQVLMESRCMQCQADPGYHKPSCPRVGETVQEVSAESIAAKVGKSVSYVYQRLKLLALIPAAREGFQTGRITAGHAVLIARLMPADQVKALGACFSIYSDALKEFKDHDPQNLQFGMIVAEEEDFPHGLMPEKALRDWIQENVNLRLKDVPWDLEDAKLVSAAGPCTTCLKRSTSNPALFAELAVKGEDTCFDAACYKAKRDAFVKITLKSNQKEAKQESKEPILQISEKPCYMAPTENTSVYRAGQWLPAAKGSCDFDRPAMIVKGENAGAIKHVCIDPKCKVHKHNFDSASRSSSQGRTDYDAQHYQDHKKRIRDKKHLIARAALAKDIVAKIGAKLDEEILRQVAAVMSDRQDSMGFLLGDPKLNIQKEIEKAKGARLNQLIVAGLLEEDLNHWADNAKSRARLVEFGKQVGLKNPKSVLDQQDDRLAKAKACRGCGCTEEAACEYWDGNKHVHCHWVKGEENLCSNPDCVKHATKSQTSAKAAKAGKK